MREAAILRSLPSHPRVVGLLDSWSEPLTLAGASEPCAEAPVLVFELLSMTALEALEQLGAFPRKACAALCAQLCDALAHVHAHGVVHRDVKPENVMLCPVEGEAFLETPALKLCDLGAARRLDSSEPMVGAELELTHYIGSRWYRAPELMANSCDYGFAVDVWGAACIVCELATGEPLFPGDDEHAVLKRCCELVGPFPPAVEHSLHSRGVPRDVLRCCTSTQQSLSDAHGGALRRALGDTALSLLEDMLRPSATRRITAANARDDPRCRFDETAATAAVAGETRAAEKAASEQRRLALEAQPEEEVEDELFDEIVGEEVDETEQDYTAVREDERAPLEAA